MHAWLLQSFDGTDFLKIEEVPDPKPAANEIVLRLEFAALNPADRYLSQGRYPAKPPLPHILGRDGVGIVDEIGDNADAVAAEDVGEGRLGGVAALGEIAIGGI